MSFGFSDHLRQTHNATRVATVEEIDWEKREFRARSGDILTNWLPFPAFTTHNYRHWIPLRKQAQIILSVDGGDYNTATVIGMIWSEEIPEFDDGTIVEYDSKRKKLLVDTPGEITLRAKAIKFESASLTHNGVNVGDTHVHPGVMSGPSVTGTPQ